MKAQDIKFSRREKKRKKHEAQERSHFRQFVESNRPKEKYKRNHRQCRSMQEWISEYGDDEE
jgi:hypothetical protein